MVLLITILLICFIASVPIAVALGFSSVVAMQIDGMPMTQAIVKVFSSLNEFALMAVPFFIMAGTIMQTGGMARRLMDFAKSIVGFITGGLGAATVLATMLFSTMSGSSSATTAAIGSVTIPSLEKKGYDRPFAAALVAAAGELGSIIPPSLNMIVYGLIANVSIGSMFIAGIVPGIMIGLSLMITVVIISNRKGFDKAVRVSRTEYAKQVWISFKDSIFALLMPVIILGGIYSGLFTPTESAVVAVVYGIFVGMFVYRELTLRDLMKTFTSAAITTSILMIIVGFASVFGYYLTINRIPQTIATTLTDFTDNPIVFLILINILILIIGMFLETMASIIILAPIFAPVAVQFGIDPLHFGIVMLFNLAIGMVTPPVAVNLFVASEVANLRIDQMVRPALIFVAVLILDLIIITYLPILSTWLPSL